MAARKPLVVVSGTLQELPATDILLFNIPQVIEVTDNTSAALRITQLGTGPALLVEDSSNPDSTPFVIDASGNVVVGSTAADVTSAGNTPAYQVLGAGDNNASMFLVRYSANTGSGTMRMGKSRSTTVGGRGAVQSGDNLGILSMYGDDGTNFILGAQIIAAVDGTPGTNDMPGRLVFFTTADGASSPTERMRINSSGNMGIGGAPSAGRSLEILKQLTGSSFSYQVNANYQIASDVSTEAATFQSFVATQAAAFTLANLRHFKAVQSTIGAGSSITNQYGFFADSTLIGATNNYGFYSNIASGANRYNFYAAGTADNYFAGNVGVGITVPGYPLHVRKDSTSADTWVTSQNGTSTGASGAGFLALQGTAGTNYSYWRQGADGNTYNVNANANGAFLWFSGASERMRLTKEGYLGLGTTPTLPSGAAYMLAIGDADTGIGQISDGRLALYGNGLPRLICETSGHLTANSTGGEIDFFIGPQTKSGYLYGSSDTIGIYSGTSGLNIFGSKDSANRYITLDTGSETGSVCTIRSQYVYLSGSGSEVVSAIINNNNGVTTSKVGTLRFYGRDTVDTLKETFSITVSPNENDYTNSYMSFYGRTSDAMAERFRIGPSGQFGIGGANYGTSGQVLTSGGSGAAPSWTTLSGGSSQWANTAQGIEYTGGKVGIEDQLELEIPASIVVANANTINLYAKRMCYNGNYAKMMVATQDTSGIEDVLQSSIWRKKIALWDAPGNTTTVPGVMGLVPPTAVGTATSRNVSTTNVQTRARRLGYVSASTAGSLSGHYINQAQVTIGGGDGFGGFFYSCRFGISASAANARAFIGLSSNTSTPTNVSPATLTNCLGVGFDSGNSTLSVYWGGSTAHTPLPCTSNFPVSTSDLYEFTIYNPSNSSLYVYWRLERLGTSFVVDGVFGVTPGTDIPANTTMLAHRAWICNGSTASAVAIDIASIYMETLY